jgi:tRNA nucleotidyltransferase (CCA-adding enzyme)
VFIQVLRDCQALGVLLPEVDALFGVPQPEKYHPEIDTGVHLLMALDLAASLQPGNHRMVFAVLLHDLGKGITDPRLLPSHPGHEATGLPLVDAVCGRLKVPSAVQDLARKVCENHLRCHRLMEAKASTVMRLLEALDVFRQPQILEDFLLACEADYRGREGMQERDYPQGDYLRRAHAAASAILARDLDLAGLNGPEVGQRLREARIKAIAAIPKHERG